MDNIYNIDYNKLIANLMPTFLRKRVHFDWLASLFSPIKNLYAEFKKFRSNSIYKATHNSQVFSIQNVFNDRYDPNLRRIFIRKSFHDADNSVYIYPNADDKPVYLPFYIYASSPFDPNEIDFEIVIPIDLKPIDNTGLNLMENEIITLANYYKLASKRYGIVWIN